MFATFITEKDAQTFTDKIHEYLTKNRPDYNAEKWADPVKHQSEDLWAISLPPEHIEGNYKIVENLDGWFPEPEI